MPPEDFSEFLSDDLICPLRWMELIKPQEGVWIRQSLAVLAIYVAVVVKPCHIRWGTEIVGRVVVDVRDLPWSVIRVVIYQCFALTSPYMSITAKKAPGYRREISNSNGV